MTLFRNLGPFHTTAIGHGEMPLTIENNRGHDVGIETLHASLDAGCRHIDTAWAYYTPGEEEQTGEKLVREALDTWKGPREEVTVATKVGLRRAWDGDKPIWPRDGKPEHLIEYGKQSAQALGVDSIDLLTCIATIRKCRTTSPAKVSRRCSTRALPSGRACPT